jgi:hypothetical protein
MPDVFGADFYETLTVALHEDTTSGTTIGYNHQVPEVCLMVVPRK